MRIVIGYDGSTHSDAAIEDLKLAGLPHDSEILIVSVADLLMSGPEISEVMDEVLTPLRVRSGLEKSRSHADRVTHEAEEAGSRALTRVRELFPEGDVRTEIKTGTPAWVLIDTSKQWNGDLVVVGSHGHSAFKRIFLGSVSKRVVTDAAASVRISRPRRSSDPDAPPRIIVGVDGSPAAEEAIHAVGQRVWPKGTEVRLITVDDSTSRAPIATRLPQAAAMLDSYFQKRESRVSAMLEWATKEFEAIGLSTLVDVRKGDAKSILLAQAEELNADTIFVGTRDFQSAFQRFRLGSVSTAIVTRAPCSVEVIRPPGGDEGLDEVSSEAEIE